MSLEIVFLCKQPQDFVLPLLKLLVSTVISLPQSHVQTQAVRPLILGAS
jgi:hypothetical protein